MSPIETPIFHLEKVVKVRDADMEDFNGPLDLILHLLSKNKMEIKDIQISLILDQYLAWMDQRKELDLEVASEFVTMAAHLVYIKTRMLLSIHDEEALSEMEQLIASLEEHQRHESFAKKGDLLRALLSALERADHRLPPPMAAFEGIVGREPYPVADKANEILQRLMEFGVTRFRALFRGNRSRSEVVATFIAVLELCRARRLRLAGTESDCTVTCTGEAGELSFSTDGFDGAEGG